MIGQVHFNYAKVSSLSIPDIVYMALVYCFKKERLHGNINIDVIGKHIEDDCVFFPDFSYSIAVILIRTIGVVPIWLIMRPWLYAALYQTP